MPFRAFLSFGYTTGEFYEENLSHAQPWALLMSGAAMAATAGNEGGQATSNQNAPATGSVPSGTPSVSAQSTGAYPGAVGPTGSHQPDATNPVRSNPSGGGGTGGGGGAGTGH